MSIIRIFLEFFRLIMMYSSRLFRELFETLQSSHFSSCRFPAARLQRKILDYCISEIFFTGNVFVWGFTFMGYLESFSKHYK